MFSRWRQLPPRPFGYRPNREMFGGRTRPAFDNASAAAAAARLVVDGLLQPQRCARLVEFHRRDPTLPALNEILQALVGAVFDAAPAAERHAGLMRVVQTVAVDGLVGLAADADAAVAARAAAEMELVRLLDRLETGAEAGTAEQAHRRFLAREIRRYLERPAGETGFPVRVPDAPPGSPIGALPDLAGCSVDSD